MNKKLARLASRLAARRRLRLSPPARLGRAAGGRDDVDVDRQLVLQDRRQADRHGRLHHARSREPVHAVAGVPEGPVHLHQGPVRRRPAGDHEGEERRARHRQARPAARRPRPLGPQLGHAGVVAPDRRTDDRQPLGVPAGQRAGRHRRRLPDRQRRREVRSRRRRHHARRALEPQRRQHQSDPALRARAVPPAGARRHGRPARRRRRGLPQRRRQSRVPLHRRFARGPALVLRQQLGERVRPRQGHRRRRRQLRLAARQSRRGDEGRGADAGRRMDRDRRRSRRADGRSGDPSEDLCAEPLGRPLQSVLARHAVPVQGRRAAQLPRRAEDPAHRADAVLRQVRPDALRRGARSEPGGQEHARVRRDAALQPVAPRCGRAGRVDQRRRRLRRGLRRAKPVGAGVRACRRPRSPASRSWPTTSP